MTNTLPFGFGSTAIDVIAGIDLTGQRAVITGGASGIGVETARALAIAGAEIVLAVRRPDAAEEVATRLRVDTGNPAISVRALDVANAQSVRDFVAAWNGPLHMLINNAGIMALPTLERTAEGVEMQFATNFLGHFALTVGLHGALASGATTGLGARLVSVSSSANLMAPVFFDDPHFRFIAYDPFLAYGQSKTACTLMAVEAGRRWQDDGILAFSLNPGAISTNLQKYTGGLRTPKERQKTAEQGAATSVLLAASPLVAELGGRYFEDCQVANVVTERSADYSGVANYAVDHDNAARLWSMAVAMIGD